MKSALLIVGICLVMLLVLVFALGCAAIPFALVGWSLDWQLDSDKDAVIASVVCGNVTGIAGLAFLGWVVSLFPQKRSEE